jgi:hypothetical protein
MPALANPSSRRSGTGSVKGFSPQLFLAAQSFVQRHRLQLVHNPRARLHHPVPMPQQLPQISILRARYPDSRKAIFQQQSQYQLRILAIRYAHPKTTTSHSCPMRAKRCQRGCNRKSGHSETLAGTRQSGLKFSMSGYCPTEPFRWNRSP